MEADKHEDPSAANTSMISGNSPYQPTTEPVPNRTTLCGGMIVDVFYVKSLPGLLKLVEVILSIIVLICLAFVSMCRDGSCSAVSFFRAVAVSALIVTLLLFLIFGLALKEKIHFINWVTTDLVNAVIFTVLYLISSSVMAAKTVQSADKAAIAFGFFATVAYGVSSWMAYRAFVIDRHKKRSNVSHIQGVPEQPDEPI